MDDVIIVGAGPAGLALAAELFRLGRRPRIVDRQAAGANTSRAAVVHARTLEALEPLGIVPALLSDGIRVPLFRIHERDAVLAEIGFEDIPSDYNYTLMCPQNLTEKRLLERLEGLGGQVERPAEAFAIAPGSDHVGLRLRQGSAAAPAACRWLVGCDGGHSLVREAAGIPFRGGAYTESFVLADVRMSWPIERAEVSLFFSPEGLLVVAPLPDERFRIVATVGEAPQEPPASLFEALLRRRGPRGAGAIEEVVWASRFHIQHRVSDLPRKGRVLLCGDAAHLHSPAGGQGMNTGIQDAVSLASALDLVLGGGSESALDEWAQERHRIARGVVETTDRLTRLATLKSGPARAARNSLLRFVAGFPSVQTALATRLAELRQ